MHREASTQGRAQEGTAALPQGTGKGRAQRMTGYTGPLASVHPGASWMHSMASTGKHIASQIQRTEGATAEGKQGTDSKGRRIAHRHSTAPLKHNREAGKQGH